MDQPIKLCRALLWAFAVFYWNQELEEYEEHIERLLAESHRFNLDSLQMFGEAMQGIALLSRDEVNVALVMLKGAVEKMQSHRFGGASGFYTPLALAFAAANQGNEALDTIDQAIAEARSRNFLMEMPDMLRARGEVLILNGSPEFSQAEESFRQSLELAQTQGALGYELRTAVSLARLWLQQGRSERSSRPARAGLCPIFRGLQYPLAHGGQRIAERVEVTASGLGGNRLTRAMCSRDTSAAAYSAASGTRSAAGSDAALAWRGGPIRTGWNSTAAAIVHSSASAIIFPMLDMPG